LQSATGADSLECTGRLVEVVPPTLRESAELTKDKTVRPLEFGQPQLLRWLYVGRLTLTFGVWLGLLVAWVEATPETSRIATLVLLASFVGTIAEFWYTHILDREPGHNFLYAHVVFDVALVTGIVHVVGDFTFVPAYILVITEGALLLPLPGGMLIGALVSIVYFADYVWTNPESTLSGAVSLQILLFALVALITGWLGDRVRRTGIALGAIQSELTRLRLDTGDILGNISTGVLTVDAAGRMAYLNRAGEELLGIDSSEWMDSLVLGAVDAASPGLASVIRRTIEQRQPIDRIKSPVRREGGDLVLGVSTTVLDREGESSPSVTAIFQDITELERLSLLDRRNERLEAVAELSASLAHEIKNPLASIRSAVEQLTAGKLEPDDQDLLRRLVLNESDRLSRLLTDFLEFSVLKLTPQASVDVAAIVSDCASLVRQHPDAVGGPEIHLEGIRGPVSIPGDQDLLHRLVFNLMLNAVQFAGPSGSVRIRVEDRSDELSPAGLQVASPVRISVEDSGPGISEEDLGRIFDPFFTTRTGGSGLGLTLVHRAVEAHGGALLVERSPEGGAQFLIYLPGMAGAGKTEADSKVEVG
jgi:two-component system sensor histidine kinase PilS (NtrC family)